MSVAVSSFLAKTPNPSSVVAPPRTAAASSAAGRLAPLRTRNFSIAAHNVSYPLGIGFRSLSVRRRSSSFVTFAASDDESKHSEVNVEREKDDLKKSAGELEESWKQTLAAFKEEGLKMQKISGEAYDKFSKEAIIILKKSSEQLKVQAEKARQDFSIVAKEVSEDGKVYLSAAAEHSPEPVKEIVETFSSPTEDLNDISKVRDFYVGIPYGLFLSLGGFLSFMITGSIPAIRFGIILGGALLALSIASLKSYKRGESSSGRVLKGQAGITGVLFLRELLLFSKRPTLFSFLATLISGGVVAFYLYRIKQHHGQMKRSFDGEGSEA